MSCGTAVSGEGTALVVTRLSPEQKFDEAITLLRSAIQMQGDQTRNLTSHLRMMSRSEIDFATKRMAENALVQAEVKIEDSTALISETETMIQQLKTGQIPQNSGWLSFKKTVTPTQISERVEFNLNMLRKYDGVIDGYVEKLVFAISQSDLGLRQLVSEQQTLNRVIQEALNLSKAGSANSIELPQFVLEARDFILIIEKQIEALTEQRKNLSLSLTLLNSERQTLRSFLSVRLPMLRPQALVTREAPQQEVVVKADGPRQVMLTPELLENGFRTPLVGDQIRLLMLSGWTSRRIKTFERYHYNVSHLLPLLKTTYYLDLIVKEEEATKKLYADMQRARSPVLGIKRSDARGEFEINATRWSWRIIRDSTKAFHDYLYYKATDERHVLEFILSNPEIKIGEFKIGDIVQIKSADLEKKIPLPRFFKSGLVDLNLNLGEVRNVGIDLVLKFRILGSKLQLGEQLVAVKGYYENIHDGRIESPFFDFIRLKDITGGAFELAPNSKDQK